MKRKLLLTSLLFAFYTSIYAQKIIPNISARVDTTKTEINKVYHLYSEYLNSKPDSIYANPYWNEKEYSYYLKTNDLRIDRAANVMFYDDDSNSFIDNYKPLILQIDSIAENLYQIKTIFKSNGTDANSDKFSVPYITNIYASRNNKGFYKLENTISERTKNWKRVRYKFITYIINPDCDFNKKEAAKAVRFCERLSKEFSLEILPFKYYILPNSDELGKLYNFEYWTYYIGAQTNLPLREIFTTYGNENYPHELVHMMFPLRKDKSSARPTIISEGLATWLGGPKLGKTFKEALFEVSNTLRAIKNPSLEDIKNYKIRNKFDNNILYVSGAVLCKLVFEKKGKEGIWQLYNSNEENLNSIIENLFELPIKDIDKNIIDYILNQTK